jgi:hypothetical protein
LLDLTLPQPYLVQPAHGAAQAGQVGLEALAGHLAPEDAALRAAVREGADALAAAVAKIGKVVLTAPADSKARHQRPRCRAGALVPWPARHGVAHPWRGAVRGATPRTPPHLLRKASASMGACTHRRWLPLAPAAPGGCVVPGAAQLERPQEPAPPRRARRRVRRTRPARSRSSRAWRRPGWSWTRARCARWRSRRPPPTTSAWGSLWACSRRAAPLQRPHPILTLPDSIAPAATN